MPFFVVLAIFLGNIKGAEEDNFLSQIDNPEVINLVNTKMTDWEETKVHGFYKGSSGRGLCGKALWNNEKADSEHVSKEEELLNNRSYLTARGKSLYIDRLFYLTISKLNKLKVIDFNFYFKYFSPEELNEAQKEVKECLENKPDLMVVFRTGQEISKIFRIGN